ncbi:MAG: hypothetical protein EP314_07030 [Bacteroidetes bacterium]|nr:MAG: hypothetical protein EP314_07030 [Bacteroidota bacterium]
METISRIVLTVLLLIFSVLIAQAQKDSTVFDNRLGIDNSYTGLSYLESAVYGFHITYTMKRHAVALGPHIAYVNLFEGQSDWERYGVSFLYQYFPIRSNRLFSPFLFYDLNYGFIRSRREVTLETPDGSGSYAASREVVSNSIMHHFGIGTRCNFYKGFFLHLSLGAGPGSFGQTIKNRSLQVAYPDTKQSEHPFSNYETGMMFRVGIAYQVGLSELRKGNPENCCN